MQLLFLKTVSTFIGVKSMFSVVKFSLNQQSSLHSTLYSFMPGRKPIFENLNIQQIIDQILSVVLLLGCLLINVVFCRKNRGYNYRKCYLSLPTQGLINCIDYCVFCGLWHVVMCKYLSKCCFAGAQSKMTLTLC